MKTDVCLVFPAWKEVLVLAETILQELWRPGHTVQELLEISDISS